MCEEWDIYDENRNKLNKIVKRGEILSEGEYHLVINAWIKNEKGEFLISQRSENKTFPLMWECTGGSALKGETSLDAAIREVKEELGINLDRNSAKLIGSARRHFRRTSDIFDVWLFEDNTPIEKVEIQKEEVNDVMWATKEQIMDLYKNGMFEANDFFEEVVN